MAIVMKKNIKVIFYLKNLFKFIFFIFNQKLILIIYDVMLIFLLVI